MDMSSKAWSAGMAVAALTVLAPRADAATFVLDFSDATCGGGFACANYQPIDQTYGDIAGLLDVRTRYELTADFDAPGRGVLFTGVYFAGGDKVAVGGVTDDSGVPEIQLIPLNGATVKLLQVRLVPAGSFRRDSEARVIDLGGRLPDVASGRFGVEISAPKILNYDFASAQGVSFRWGPNAINVGVDSITFEVTAPPPPPGGRAVPEPSVWALLIAGFGAVGGLLRRRRSAERTA
jgi:hypothetical protein